MGAARGCALAGGSVGYSIRKLGEIFASPWSLLLNGRALSFEAVQHRG